MIAKMKEDINTLSRQQAYIQDIFKKLIKETKATILKKIKEVEDSFAIQDDKFDYPPE